MSSVNKTPHYNLSQFGDNPDDKPSWRGDYTGDMSKIDSQMYRNETDATTATSTANTAKTTADNALSLAQANKADITEQESYFNALGVTSAQTAQALMSTINGKAENTALTSLQGTVSSLSDTVNGKANTAEVYTKAQADARYTQQGGYSGTAQTLNQRINTNTSDISVLKAWNTAFSNGWADLGAFTYTCQPSAAIGTDSRSNIKCLYNEKIGAIKLFGMFAVHPISGQSQNFTSLSVVSQNALPVSMRPSADVHMDAALALCMNGIDSTGAGSYTDIVTIPCCVTVKASGHVLLGETAKAQYYDAIQNHARQSFRVLMPQCIYTLAQ
jgi:hypothetical protein|nr:MAG TPA: hypothetical protein [Caudoviricetes sp.]